MSWNWEVFLKSWLFGFLGFLIGVVSIVIYLAVDVDLGKLDGTLIATCILVGITACYAYSTHKILRDQQKSREMRYLRDRLEKLYLPLKDVLENPHTLYGKSEKQIGWLKTEDIIPYQYLAYNESVEKIKDFIKYVLELKEKDNLSFENIRNHTIIDVIKKDIDRCKNELNELIKR